MNWFKQWIKNIAEALGVTLVSVLVGISIVLYLLLCPIEMLRYHRTPYYRATKRKYKPFAVWGWQTKIYNHLAKTGTPFEYHYSKDCEFYVLNDQVLIPGFTADQVRHLEDMWYLASDEEEPSRLELMQTVVAEERDCIPEKYQQLPIKLLIFNDSDEHIDDDFLLCQQCPYLACYDSVNDM